MEIVNKIEKSFPYIKNDEAKMKNIERNANTACVCDIAHWIHKR